MIIMTPELLILFDLHSFKLDKFVSLGQQVTSLCLASNDSILLVGTSDSSIHILDLDNFTVLSSHPGLPSEVTSITPIAAQPHHYYLCHKRGFEHMRIEAPSSLERLTETYMHGQEIRCLVPTFNSQNEYIVNGFEEDG